MRNNAGFQNLNYMRDDIYYCLTSSLILLIRWKQQQTKDLAAKLGVFGNITKLGKFVCWNYLSRHMI